VQLAIGFLPLPPQEIATILKRTALAAGDGKYELFKTSSHFDSTAQHPEWLGPETSQVQQLGKNS